MNTSANTAESKVVIVGAGIAGLESALALKHLAPGMFDVTLVAATDQFTFVPAVVAAPFDRAVVRHFDLFRIANDVGARLVVGRVAGVDPGHRRVALNHGPDLEYDALLIACGTTSVPAVPGAITFAGPGSGEAMRTVISDVVSGQATRLLFASPAAVSWTLPLYELCLLSSQYLSDNDTIWHYGNGNMRRNPVRLGLVTPESSPLATFGDQASHEVSAVFAQREIDFYGSSTPIRFQNGSLEIGPNGRNLEADRVIALPRLHGVAIEGIPSDHEGFIRTDPHGHVNGLENVYAAGDITTFPIKQGGLAAQQAVAAARSIAAAAGASVAREPFDPVLRGLLLTGDQDRYLRAEVEGGRGSGTVVDAAPLWWPPGKLAAHYLTPYLSQLDVELETRLV